MKTKLVQITALVLGLVFAAALQDLAPAFAGVKPPMLIACALFIAFASPLVPTLVFATIAGLVCDALSGVSAFTAIGYFVLLALGVYYVRAGTRMDKELPNYMLGAIAVPVAAAIGETWSTLCGIGGSGLLVRICAAALWGVPLGAVTFALFPVLKRHIGLEETP